MPAAWLATIPMALRNFSGGRFISLAGRHRGADRADNPCRMKAVIVEFARRQRAKPCGHFAAGDNCGEQTLAVGLQCFSQCQCGGNYRCTDMDARKTVSVIEVMHMRHGAIGQGRHRWH